MRRRGPIVPKHPIRRPATITVLVGDKALAPRHALTELRREAGYSRAALSITLGRCPDIVRHWERGDYVASVENWIDAVQACGWRVVVEKEDFAQNTKPFSRD